MRCPDCNKFVSYDEPQCEIDSVDVNGSDVRACVTVQLNCQDCGTTLKDANIEQEQGISHTCLPEAERDKTWVPDPDYKEDDAEQFVVENEGDAEGTSRTQSTDRNGKPIRLARYQKTFYGFTLISELQCRKCGEVFDVTLEGEEQASGFNECC